MQLKTSKPEVYSPRTLSKVYTLKKDNKKRLLGTPHLHDRVKQIMFAIALRPVTETTVDTDSYGFRLKRPCADTVAQWAFVNEMKHDQIMENTPSNKSILRELLKMWYSEKKRLYPTFKGTLLGGIISPPIVKMVLDRTEYS